MIPHVVAENIAEC